MNNSGEIFCPACNFKNDAAARICVHCHKPLHIKLSGSQTTKTVSDSPKLPTVTELLKNSSVPEDGIVFFSQESAQAIVTVMDDNFILGRVMEGVREPVIDLSAFGAYGLGVSRLHAFFKKTEAGYEVRDMNSTNGTWLNDESLVPNQQYPIKNGDRIRLGKLGLIVLFGKQA